MSGTDFIIIGIAAAVFAVLAMLWLRAQKDAGLSAAERALNAEWRDAKMYSFFGAEFSNAETYAGNRFSADFSWRIQAGAGGAELRKTVLGIVRIADCHYRGGVIPVS